MAVCLSSDAGRSLASARLQVPDTSGVEAEAGFSVGQPGRDSGRVRVTTATPTTTIPRGDGRAVRTDDPSAVPAGLFRRMSTEGRPTGAPCTVPRGSRCSVPFPTRPWLATVRYEVSAAGGVRICQAPCRGRAGRGAQGSDVEASDCRFGSRRHWPGHCLFLAATRGRGDRRSSGPGPSHGGSGPRGAARRRRERCPRRERPGRPARRRPRDRGDHLGSARGGRLPAAAAGAFVQRPEPLRRAGLSVAGSHPDLARRSTTRRRRMA